MQTVSITYFIFSSIKGNDKIYLEVSEKKVAANFYQNQELDKDFIIYNDTILNNWNKEVVLIPKRNYKNVFEKIVSKCQIALLLNDSLINIKGDSIYRLTTDYEFMKSIEDLAYFNRTCVVPFDQILSNNYQVELKVDNFPSTFKLRGDILLAQGNEEKKERFYNLALTNYEAAEQLLKQHPQIFKDEIVSIQNHIRLASTKRNGIAISPTHEFVKIPAGTHISKLGAGDSSIQTLRALPTFYIDKYEVSVAQFRKFRDDLRFIPDVEGYKNYLPAVNISWDLANAYCKYFGLRLPTELEWEKAALWDENNKSLGQYPWKDSQKGNTNLGHSPPKILKVQSNPEGTSNYKIHNLFGNVAEWMNVEPGQDNSIHVACGGAYIHDYESADKAVRMVINGPKEWVGFRCACDANNLPPDLMVDYYSN